jgi:hypothetical protein
MKRTEPTPSELLHARARLVTEAAKDFKAGRPVTIPTNDMVEAEAKRSLAKKQEVVKVAQARHRQLLKTDPEYLQEMRKHAQHAREVRSARLRGNRAS